MYGMGKMESTAGGVGTLGELAVRTKSEGLELGIRELEIEMESLRKEVIGAGIRRRRCEMDGEWLIKSFCVFRNILGG